MIVWLTLIDVTITLCWYKTSIWRGISRIVLVLVFVLLWLVCYSNILMKGILCRQDESHSYIVSSEFVTHWYCAIPTNLFCILTSFRLSHFINHDWIYDEELTLCVIFIIFEFDFFHLQYYNNMRFNCIVDICSMIIILKYTLKKYLIIFTLNLH